MNDAIVKAVRGCCDCDQKHDFFFQSGVLYEGIIVAKRAIKNGNAALFLGVVLVGWVPCAGGSVVHVTCTLASYSNINTCLLQLQHRSLRHLRRHLLRRTQDQLL